MSIQVGNKIPDVTLKRLGADGMEEVSTGDLFAGKKVVLFAVPGAFTPTCSAKHLPGFIDHADELASKGVDAVACMSVNDPFVMQAWEKSQNASDVVEMLPDGNGEFTKALGLEMDGTAFGLGPRSKRFALIAQDGVVEELLVEEAGGLDVSSAENVLSKL
ncbi:MAG: peroxiredoxin [Pseudomonadota bacterium]